MRANPLNFSQEAKRKWKAVLPLNNTGNYTVRKTMEGSVQVQECFDLPFIQKDKSLPEASGCVNGINC